MTENTDNRENQQGTGPEHRDVRVPLVKDLLSVGWKGKQVQWEPEWRVPKSPSEHSKREAGKTYKGFPVDVIIWESEERREDPEAALIIFETKKPTVSEGRKQLENYLSLEYTVKMGYWTNGKESLAIYRLPTGGFRHVNDAPIPKPTDSFTMTGDRKLSFVDLKEPSPVELRSRLDRLFDAVVARDTVSTRSDQRLNQLCNLLLTKLDSDQRAKRDQERPLTFQPGTTEQETSANIRQAFTNLKTIQPAIFSSNDDETIRFDDHTIHNVVCELAAIKLVDVTPETISEAFQVFRSANLKSGEGQYFTPARVISSAVEVMEINHDDRVIDPACGTGGFLVESFLSLLRRYPELSSAEHQKWAQQRIFGVDRDDINVKLARAIMQIIGDGSSNIEVGDSLLQHMWPLNYPHLNSTLKDESFTCIITNPPFGNKLKIAEKDSRLSEYSIAKKGKDQFSEIEVGLVFLERCYRLLVDNGRLGIILPETYWFSSTYAWLKEWLEERFTLRGMFNVPMEAFQSFCRAKTNFYVLEKIPNEDGDTQQMAAVVPRPSWFVDGNVVVSSAERCGINKDGIDQAIVHPGQIAIDDLLHDDISAICDGKNTATTYVVPLDQIMKSWIAVPSHYDMSSLRSFYDTKEKLWTEWSVKSLGEMIDCEWIIRRDGHGSPSKDMRDGNIPYIKVSDLRAGVVNINPSNLVLPEVAQKLWKGKDAGLEAFDLLSPERASSNIGEFCVLMPGQEQIVLTREVIVLRVTSQAPFDSFYLLWALSLNVVRDQWKRQIFMQTNREDVGHRYRNILLPIPESPVEAKEVSVEFAKYYNGLAQLREAFSASLSGDRLHHDTLLSGIRS